MKKSVQNATSDRRCAIACVILVVFIGIHFRWYTYYIFQWCTIVYIVYRYWRLALILPLVFIRKIKGLGTDRQSQYAKEYFFGAERWLEE